MNEVLERNDANGDQPESTASRPLWERWSRLPDQDSRGRRWLAECRRGVGKRAGSVPEMWPHYCVREEGVQGERALDAEHVCLVLFGFHQQSQSEPVHMSGRSFAAALNALRRTERFRERESALDSRVYAAATATSLAELQAHLRTLISLLRTESIGFDYTGLYKDILRWQRPGGPDEVRRSWGRAYVARRANDDSASPGSDTPDSASTKGSEK